VHTTPQPKERSSGEPVFVNIVGITMFLSLVRDEQILMWTSTLKYDYHLHSPAKTSATKLVARVIICVSPCKNTGIDRIVPTNGKTMSVSCDSKSIKDQYITKIWDIASVTNSSLDALLTLIIAHIIKKNLPRLIGNIRNKKQH
jgi:hypothetical protein